jgi:hypothetical protein
MVVLQPSATTMESLLLYLDTSPTIAEAKFADQDVIAEAFHGRWRPLPWWSNALKTQRAVHPDLWLDTEARLVHYMWVGLRDAADLQSGQTLVEAAAGPRIRAGSVRDGIAAGTRRCGQADAAAEESHGV